MFDDEPPVAFGPKLFPKNKINSTMPENENTKLIQDDVTAKPIRTNKKKSSTSTSNKNIHQKCGYDFCLEIDELCLQRL